MRCVIKKFLTALKNHKATISLLVISALYLKSTSSDLDFETQIDEFKNAIERAIKNHEYSNSLTFTYPQVSEMIPLTTPEIVEFYENQGFKMPRLEVHKVFTIEIEKKLF